MPARLKPLAEQIIVITGASSGIGLATARRAADSGARVILVARNKQALDEAVEQIKLKGGRAAALALDIADEDAAARIGSFCDERFGSFDSWINDAAVAIYGKLDETSMEEHRRVFDVGYFGLVAASL
jgi:short-subunit dehydrogenase